MLDFIIYSISQSITPEMDMSNIGIMCTLSAFPHIRQFVQYNGKLDRLEIPISKLEENNIKVYDEKTSFLVGGRSKVECYVDKTTNILCFEIKTDW